MEHVKIHRSIAKLSRMDMFYFDTKTKGPVILCLHGRWGRAETWYHFIQHYGKQYRIIAPDQRGHGLSSKPVTRYTSEEMAEDVIDLIRYLGLTSVILAGHSMGSNIAATCVAMHPEYFNGLALLDRTAAGPDCISSLPLKDLPHCDSVTKDWPPLFDSLAQAMTFLRQSTESEFSYQYFMNSLRETPEGYQMMFSTQAMAANEEYYTGWFNLLPALTCPVLLISAKGYAAYSTKECFQKMQALIPNCIAHVMSHEDHNVQLACKKEFYSYFDELLDRVSSAGSVR